MGTRNGFLTVELAEEYLRRTNGHVHVRVHPTASRHDSVGHFGAAVLLNVTKRGIGTYRPERGAQKPYPKAPITLMKLQASYHPELVKEPDPTVEVQEIVDTKGPLTDFLSNKSARQQLARAGGPLWVRLSERETTKCHLTSPHGQLLRVTGPTTAAFLPAGVKDEIVVDLTQARIMKDRHSSMFTTHRLAPLVVNVAARSALRDTGMAVPSDSSAMERLVMPTREETALHPAQKALRDDINDSMSRGQSFSEAVSGPNRPHANQQFFGPEHVDGVPAQQQHADALHELPPEDSYVIVRQSDNHVMTIDGSFVDDPEQSHAFSSEHEAQSRVRQLAALGGLPNEKSIDARAVTFSHYLNTWVEPAVAKPEESLPKENKVRGLTELAEELQIALTNSEASRRAVSFLDKNIEDLRALVARAEESLRQAKGQLEDAVLSRETHLQALRAASQDIARINAEYSVALSTNKSTTG